MSALQNCIDQAGLHTHGSSNGCDLLITRGEFTEAHVLPEAVSNELEHRPENYQIIYYEVCLLSNCKDTVQYVFMFEQTIRNGDQAYCIIVYQPRRAWARTHDLIID